jgi:hypothetical protein
VIGEAAPVEKLDDFPMLLIFLGRRLEIQTHIGHRLAALRTWSGIDSVRWLQVLGPFGDRQALKPFATSKASKVLFIWSILCIPAHGSSPSPSGFSLIVPASGL